MISFEGRQIYVTGGFFNEGICVPFAAVIGRWPDLLRGDGGILLAKAQGFRC
jgi:hypothetical protein